MRIQKLDHYAVRTADVQRAIRFYENALGLCVGPRPPFKFPGAWLYKASQDGKATESAIVHLIGIKPDDTSGLSDYLGDKSPSVESGTGAFDHIAFVASDIAETYARLMHYQIPFRERKVPDMALHQVFIEDPDGVTIELNYSSPDDVSAGQDNLRLHSTT